MRKTVVNLSNVVTFIGASDQLTALQQVAAGIEQLERQWRQWLPAAFANSTHLGKPANGVLPVYCESGAVAGKLRQLAPKLEMKLAQHRLDLRLSIKVRIGQHSPPVQTRPARVLTQSALSALEQLHRSVSDGPLKVSLNTLLTDDKINRGQGST